MASAHPETICIVKLGAIGDVVNSLPFACRLRAGFPNARILWVIAPLAHALVGEHDAIDEFVVVDVKKLADWRRLVAKLRSSSIDLAIDLQRILKSGLITRVSGARRRLGFDRARCKEASWLFTNERIPPRAHPGVTVEQYLEFADYLDLPETEPEWRLPHDRWEGPAPRFCLNIGASKSANLWPAERWRELLARLASERGPIALSGGPADRALAGELMRGAPPGVLDTVGRLSLRETAGLIAASETFIGGDTGPLHIAVALGTPVVALFGAADPTRTGPYRQPDAVVYKPADCSPCRKRDCHVEGHPCMAGIQVDDVLARL